MDHRRKRLKTSRSLGEQEISDLFSDELTDVSCEMCSDSDSDSDRKQQRIMATDSKSDSSSDENVGSNIAETATWGKVDKTPTLGQFTGNPGVKQIPSDPTPVSEVAELFFGNSFFDMLCQLCICVVPEQGIVCCNIMCPNIIILYDRSAKCQ
jgi:hypothetical protein